MNKKLILSFIPIALIMIICTTATGVLHGLSTYQLVRIDIILAVCFFCIVLYIRYRCAEIFNHKGSTVTLCAGIVIMTLLMQISFTYSVIPIWIFGIVFIARRLDTGLALVYLYTVSLLQMMAGGADFLELFLPMIIGTLLCVLSSYIHSFMSAFFVFIISLTMQVTILLVWNNYELQSIINEETIRYILVMSALSFVLFYIDNILSILKSSFKDVNKTYFNITEEDENAVIQPGDILVSAAFEAKTEERRIMRKLNQMKNEYSNLEEAASKVKSETEKIKNDREHILGELESLKLMQDSLKAETKSIELDTTTIRSVNNSLHTETEKLKSESTSLKNQINNLKDDLNKMLEDNETALNRNEQLKNESVMLTTENNALHAEIEAIKAEILRLAGAKSTFNISAATVHTDDNTNTVTTNNDNILIQKLKNDLPKLYKHCLKVADIASRAAGVINADMSLSYAGGLYHEINKIYNGKTMEDIIDDISEFLPDNLIEIILQCNERNVQPSKREACLITLTDDIIATMNYLKNNNNNTISFSKIVDNVFKVRLSKGMFDNIGINQDELSSLKDYFIRWNGGMM